MTVGIARVGDRTTGTCYCHPVPINVDGTIITGSTDTFVDNLPVARLGDVVKADCGHTGTIVTSSSSVFCNNLGVARLGDQTSGCYESTIITASTDTFLT